jgi:mitochondrial enoyl-[acyl-carrier protein] reductase / trans-2-enoyl-CoA reductase
MKTTRVLRWCQCGAAEEVLELAEEPLPEVQRGEVLVQMRLAPINPSDLNLIAGTYGLKAPLPAVAGLEGVGEVMAVGEGVDRVVVGQRVAPPRTRGLWREAIVCAATELSLFPASLTVEQAAVTSVNPPTAWALLHEFVSLSPGDWVVQNAANSAVGRALIALARERGWRTLNLVRRAELVTELKGLGADEVLTYEEAAGADLMGYQAKLGSNAVGGEAAILVAKALGHRGVHVTYGAMGRQPVRIPNGMLIFKDLHFRGFWLTPWLGEVAPERLATMWAEVERAWGKGLLTPGFEKIYPLAEFRAAMRHAASGERHGKIILGLG